MNTIERTTFAPVAYSTAPVYAAPLIGESPYMANDKYTQKFLKKQAKREGKILSKQTKVANRDFAKAERYQQRADVLAIKGRDSRAIRKEDKAARYSAAAQVRQNEGLFAQQNLALNQASRGFGYPAGVPLQMVQQPVMYAPPPPVAPVGYARTVATTTYAPTSFSTYGTRF
eukprot:TRINITY_DN385_c0_g1_i1.p1 TRINITY_DN385_c0_g1~~TRINITY_DN385_c0_g1_i1.p1  ORF type:complete len:172 (+),score=60.77 TRINITY_DN385_c0_g1_i1:78-593(+)